MSNIDKEEYRRTKRQRRDPSVVKVRLQDQKGNPRWVIAYLSDVSEGGAGLALMTPLEIGSKVVIQGNFGDNQTDAQLEAEVRWRTQGSGGVFNVGLALVGSRSDDAS
jgi:hypothetical protein